MDCVESTTDSSSCTACEQELWSVTTEAANGGVACAGSSTLCTHGDGSASCPDAWTIIFSDGHCGGNDADPGGGNLGSVEACQSACNEDDLCVGFIWNTNEGGECWLKTACTDDGSDGFDFYSKPPPAEWLLLFRQTAPNYQPVDDWVQYNWPNDDPAADFSVLDTLESYRTDGGFTLKLLWPNREGDNQQVWFQTNNPVTDAGDGGVTGYQPIDVRFTDHSWGGLEHRDGANALLDGSVADCSTGGLPPSIMRIRLPRDTFLLAFLPFFLGPFIYPHARLTQNINDTATELALGGTKSGSGTT